MQHEKIFYEIRFDDEGFSASWSRDDKILWREIIRVARCMVLDSIIDIADYWAFQTKDPELLVWVSIDPLTDFIRTSFSDEVSRRFGVSPELVGGPMISACKHSNLASYVKFPKSDEGKPMYVLKLKHWWSSNGELHYALK